MSFAKILVPIAGGPADRIALQTALVAATPFNGHVEARFIQREPQTYLPYAGTMSPDVIDSIYAAMQEENRLAGARSRAVVLEAAKAADVCITLKPVKRNSVTCSLQQDAGHFATQAVRASRLADLVVFSAPPGDAFSEVGEAFVAILTKTQRPVLIAPQAPATLTSRISIGWDGSVASAHAMMAALPLLQHAGQVELLEIGLPSEHATTAVEAQDYLALYNVTATTRRVVNAGYPTGDALMNEASDTRSSLLVMGAYGHSQLREAIFGGVTRHIKWHATLPVFMAH